ncbi:MAG: hypothetical protein ABI551_17240 [Polyangiaceae bacterium]
MASLWMSFRECGFMAFVILFLSVLGLVAAVASLAVVLAVQNRRLAIGVSLVTLLLGISSLAAGAMGQAWGRGVVEKAIAGLSPEEVTVIRAQGYKEAGQCVSLGEGGGALPLVFGLVLLGASFLKKDDPSLGRGRPRSSGPPKFGA